MGFSPVFSPLTIFLHQATLSKKCWHQRDQIGRNFAQWGIVNLGKFLEKCRRSTHFCAIFCNLRKLILTKNMSDHLLGDFFTNSSGHPGWHFCVLVLTFLVNFYDPSLA
jgi:hypothetical protein